MKKNGLLCLVIFISFFGVHAAEDSPSVNLRVAFSRTPDAAFIDEGEMSGSEGFFADLLEHIAEQEGWNLQYMDRIGVSAEGLPDVDTVDLVFGMAHTAEAMEQFQFSEETLLSTWAQVVASSQRKVNTFIDLDGRTVGVVQDDPNGGGLRAIVGNLNINSSFVEFSGYAEIMDALERGWVDVGVIDHLYLQDMILPDEVTITPILFDPTALKAAVPADGDVNLLDVVDYRLAELKKNPTSVYYRLLSDFFDKESPAAVPAAVLWLLGGAGLLALWLGGFTWVLKRRVRMQTRQLSEKNKALEESRSHLQLALDVANDGLWDWEPESGRFYISPRWHTMLNYEPGEIDPDFEVMIKMVHPDDLERVRHGFNQLLRYCKRVFEEDFRLRRKGGDWFWVACRAKAVECTCDEKPLRVVGTTVDINERKNTEFELAEERQRAEAANVAKSAFLAHMSHELRTPLNAVIGLTSLLLRSDMQEDQQDYIQTIQGSGEMLLTVINDVLDLSKVEAGELKLERHVFDVRQCVESVMDLAAPRAAEKQLELSYQVEADVPCSVIGDTVRLRQVLLNLLNNAIKFTESGEVVLTVSRERLLDVEKCGLRFALRDTGIGMSTEQMSRIFHPFRQADSSTTRQYGGTGLGLTICDKLVRLMNGSFEVQSKPGTGSTFSFNVELCTAPEVVELDESLQKNLPVLVGKQILVVDDNETNREILEKHLCLWGAVPVMAANGFEALVLMENHSPFALALLDMFMPGMDGLELSRAIRERPAFKELPLVMLTSSMGHDDELKKAGLDALLFKPVKPSVLCKTLIRIFSGDPGKDSRLQKEDRTADEKNPLRLLLAEDNMVNRKVCLLLLKKLGYTADVAVNGEEAVKAVEASCYDAVLMDVQMPKMDGLAATAEICRRWPEGVRPYIIGVSAHALAEERERALSAGMNDYLSKPIHIDELRYALLKIPLPVECELSCRSV